MFSSKSSRFCSHCGHFLPWRYAKCPGCGHENSDYRPAIARGSGMQLGFPLSHLLWIYLPLWLSMVLLGRYLVSDDVVFKKHDETYWANRYWEGMLHGYPLEYLYEIKRKSGYIYCVVLWSEGNYYVRIPIAEVEKAGTSHIKAWINDHLSWADGEEKKNEWQWLDKELLILSGWPANEPLPGFARWWSKNSNNFKSAEGVSAKLAKFRQEEIDREVNYYAPWISSEVYKQAIF